MTESLNSENSRWRRSTILKNCQNAISQWQFIRFWWTLVHKCKVETRWHWHDQIWKFKKFKMADGRHFEHRFLAITQQPIIQFQWNFAQGSRITWRYSVVMKSKFLKFKMADGHHIKNRFQWFCVEKHSTEDIFFVFLIQLWLCDWRLSYSFKYT